MTIAIPSSQSVGKVRQVAFRSHSKEDCTSEAKLLVTRLQKEKKERQRMKSQRIQQQQLKLKKVNINLQSSLMF